MIYSHPILLFSTEAHPEDQVELSFLRQCLENAMASELSPHERDVLRLRLGLDDGVSRTVREVVEVCGGNISTSEVRLAEQRAYKKLRTPYSLQHHQLIAFLDFAGIDQSSMKRF
jgi:DNA-directed RNA polymerase sigma subunit (sigma70/sigma32)